MITTLRAVMAIPIVLCSTSTRPINAYSDDTVTYARESEERDRDDPQGSPLPAFRVPSRELPRHRRSRKDLDRRVQPECDQGGRRGDRARGDRDDRLDDVVGDGRRDDPADAALQHVLPLTRKH